MSLKYDILIGIIIMGRLTTQIKVKQYLLELNQRKTISKGGQTDRHCKYWIKVKAFITMIFSDENQWNSD